ncbi:hypothetical protein OIU79_028763 [Salix purpurea]|uniref:Uncharacterized protein n=1 Tax=Salix purpurea TaxID=77065 RepID=A0A9Q0VX69_SALPP|nr:hypothetical protein OIU79_028763 [Salix purpurea]
MMEHPALSVYMFPYLSPRFVAVAKDITFGGWMAFYMSRSISNGKGQETSPIYRYCPVEPFCMDNKCPMAWMIGLKCCPIEPLADTSIRGATWISLSGSFKHEHISSSLSSCLGKMQHFLYRAPFFQTNSDDQVLNEDNFSPISFSLPPVQDSGTNIWILIRVDRAHPESSHVIVISTGKQDVALFETA